MILVKNKPKITKKELKAAVARAADMQERLTHPTTAPYLGEIAWNNYVQTPIATEAVQTGWNSTVDQMPLYRQGVAPEYTENMERAIQQMRTDIFRRASTDEGVGDVTYRVERNAEPRQYSTQISVTGTTNSGTTYHQAMVVDD
jgi:hypothetical protein